LPAAPLERIPAGAAPVSAERSHALGGAVEHVTVSESPGFAATGTAPETIRGRFLRREWAVAPTKPSPVHARQVLIVSGEDGPLERALAAVHPGASVRWLRMGAGLTSKAPAAVWDEALSRGPAPERIYFVAGIEVEDEAGDELPRVSAGQENGPARFHRLVQAMARAKALQPGLSIRVVTKGAFAVQATERVLPYGAGVTGMASSLAKEFPLVDIASVDVSVAELSEAPTLAAAVAGEPAQRASEKIALRAGKRWKLRLRLAGDLPASGSRFRKKGVYLIVGGAGNVGVALSRHLASAFGARLVWVGRRACNERIAAAMRDVEGLGGEVEYVAARSDDPAAMRAAVEAAVKRFGAVHGVFHGALVFQDDRLGNLSEADCQAILDAKTRSSAALFDAVRGLDLDFLFFLGSAQSLFNEARRGAYAAACCFQDAWVERIRRLVPFPVQMVNWGFWSHGIDPALAPHIAAAGLGMIEPADGIPAIEALLAGRVAQAVYLKTNDAALRRMGVGETEGPSPVTKMPPAPVTQPSLDERIAAELFG